jgi:hypothetical protein
MTKSILYKFVKEPIGKPVNITKDDMVIMEYPYDNVMQLYTFNTTTADAITFSVNNGLNPFTLHLLTAEGDFYINGTDLVNRDYLIREISKIRCPINYYFNEGIDVFLYDKKFISFKYSHGISFLIEIVDEEIYKKVIGERYDKYISRFFIYPFLYYLKLHVKKMIFGN